MLTPTSSQKSGYAAESPTAVPLLSSAPPEAAARAPSGPFQAPSAEPAQDARTPQSPVEEKLNVTTSRSCSTQRDANMPVGPIKTFDNLFEVFAGQLKSLDETIAVMVYLFEKTPLALTMQQVRNFGSGDNSNKTSEDAFALSSEVVRDHSGCSDDVDGRKPVSTFYAQKLVTQLAQVTTRFAHLSEGLMPLITRADVQRRHHQQSTPQWSSVSAQQQRTALLQQQRHAQQVLQVALASSPVMPVNASGIHPFQHQNHPTAPTTAEPAAAMRADAASTATSAVSSLAAGHVFGGIPPIARRPMITARTPSNEYKAAATPRSNRGSDTIATTLATLIANAQAGNPPSASLVQELYEALSSSKPEGAELDALSRIASDLASLSAGPAPAVKSDLHESSSQVGQSTSTISGAQLSMSSELTTAVSESNDNDTPTTASRQGSEANLSVIRSWNSTDSTVGPSPLPSDPQGTSSLDSADSSPGAAQWTRRSGRQASRLKISGRRKRQKRDDDGDSGYTASGKQEPSRTRRRVVFQCEHLEEQRNITLEPRSEKTGVNWHRRDRCWHASWYKDGNRQKCYFNPQNKDCAACIEKSRLEAENFRLQKEVSGDASVAHRRTYHSCTHEKRQRKPPPAEPVSDVQGVRWDKRDRCWRSYWYRDRRRFYPNNKSCNQCVENARDEAERFRLQKEVSGAAEGVRTRSRRLRSKRPTRANTVLDEEDTVDSDNEEDNLLPESASDQGDEAEEDDDDEVNDGPSPLCEDMPVEGSSSPMSCSVNDKENIKDEEDDPSSVKQEPANGENDQHGDGHPDESSSKCSEYRSEGEEEGRPGCIIQQFEEISMLENANGEPSDGSRVESQLEDQEASLACGSSDLSDGDALSDDTTSL